jgi:hypothetical protein
MVSILFNRFEQGRHSLAAGHALRSHDQRLYGGLPVRQLLLGLSLPKRRRSIVSPGFVQKTSRMQVV